MKNTAYVFTNTRDRWHIFIWDTCFVPKPENIWKKVYIPQLLKKYSTWQKSRKNIQTTSKLRTKKKKHIDQIWKSQIKEIAVTLRQVEMQYDVSKFDASSSKYDAAQRGLS